MGQSIQEWTKLSLWKTAFKKSEVIWSAYGLFPFMNTLPQIFLKYFLCPQFLSKYSTTRNLIDKLKIYPI